MFRIRYLISYSDVKEYLATGDSLYGYLWFEIEGEIIGRDPMDWPLPLDFLDEAMISWMDSLDRVAGLAEGESKKCFFCTCNRLNLIFKNTDGSHMDITYTRDDEPVWTKSFDRSQILDEIEKFDRYMKSGFSYVRECE